MTTSPFDARDVVEVISILDEAGIQSWVDGGWGVDALVGEQTRVHSDLDIAMDMKDLARTRALLEERGFTVDPDASPGLPARLVLSDGRGRQVDLHPLVFDRRGDGWQQLSDRTDQWGRYPAEDLRAEGTIGSRPVRCLGPGLQFRFRLGYPRTARDEHDLRLLSERFGAGPPL